MAVWAEAARRHQMSRLDAGCPVLQEVPDVRGMGRMSGLELAFAAVLLVPDFRGGAGCPSRLGRQMSDRCRVTWQLFFFGLPLFGGARCPGSCRMSGRYSSASTPLEALLAPLPCGLALCSELIHGHLLGT
jgi:hypothetical protein